MDIAGTQTIAAPRQAVWEALNDPVVLQACLPGCERVERSAPDHYRVVMTSAIGPLRARFDGSLKLTDAAPPSSCVMVFEGRGGAVGFGKGSASVELREAGEHTELAYVARAQVGGKLAQVGSRLIDGVAKKLSDDFFEAFREQLAPAPQPASDFAATAGAVAGAAPAVAGEAAAAAAAGGAVVPAGAAPREPARGAAPSPCGAPEAAVQAGAAPAVIVAAPPWLWIALAFCGGIAVGLAARGL